MSLRPISMGWKSKGGADMEKINLARLKSCMLLAEQGGELTIGFLGGSITQGSLATGPERCYAYRVFHGGGRRFPGPRFTM